MRRSSAADGQRLAPTGAACRQASACRVLLVDGDYEAALAAAAAAPHRDSGPAPLFMFYTSGTTARPKGVVHGTTINADAMAAGQQGQVMLWGWTPDEVHLLCGPAYHAGPGGWTSTTASTVPMSIPSSRLQLLTTVRSRPFLSRPSTLRRRAADRAE